MSIRQTEQGQFSLNFHTKNKSTNIERVSRRYKGWGDEKRVSFKRK